MDAFTEVPFAGNPCAVLPDAQGLSDAEMQAIARETNLSETAFVFPSEQADFRVRYFTPRAEIPFAGHPTIATVFLLAEEGHIPLAEPVTRVRLEFPIGVLPAEVEVRKGVPRQVVMTQRRPVFGAVFSAEEVAPCLGLEVGALREDCPPQVVDTGVPFLLVPLRDLDALGQVRMDRPALQGLCRRAGVDAAFAFCLGGFSPEADTHARLLDPWGAHEDPFTGSASGAMAAYVVRHGLRPGPRLVAEQGHFVGRPGLGVLEVVGTREDLEAVRLAGAAVRVLEGDLLL
ncbi:MAG: PhzF family phenazine biosynthesis protein, partial [Anaerolineae bacterium]|nr:PhzF family phenazine biosynthesis protein [Anaerolineae bacterium]